MPHSPPALQENKEQSFPFLFILQSMENWTVMRDLHAQEQQFWE
jgi:hypothetical protein